MKGIDNIIWTKHARERADYYGLKGVAADNKLQSSNQVQLRKKVLAYKFEMYGIESLDDVYFSDQSGNWLFTCRKNGQTLTVITVTNRAMANDTQRFE